MKKDFPKTLKKVKKLSIKCYSDKDLKALKKLSTDGLNYDVRIGRRTEYKVRIYTDQEDKQRQHRASLCSHHRAWEMGSSDDDTSDEEAPEREPEGRREPAEEESEDSSDDEYDDMIMAPPGMLRMFLRSYLQHMHDNED